MKIDCSIVRDLLPLYLEDMVSEDTATYIKAHLEDCPSCAAEYAALSQESPVDQACPKTEAAVDGVVALRSVRRKIKIRTISIASIAVLLTLSIVLAYTFLCPATMDYGHSDMYTRTDIASAMAVVKDQVGTWHGCKLYAICYTSDTTCAQELAYINTLVDNSVTYTECMVLSANFRSPLFGGGAWNANMLYNWTWYLGRTQGGNWEPVTWGVG